MTSRIAKATLAPLGLVLLGSSALAQQSIIEQCKNTSSEADRIACLEAALIGKEEPPEAEVAPVAAPEPASQIDPPSMDVEAAPADTTVEPVTQSQIDPPSMEIDAGPAVTEAAAATTVESVSAESQPVGLGAEQVIARTQTKEEKQESQLQATGMVITRYEWVPYERMVVYFENGQVWRQIKGDKNRIRTSLKRNQTADITESSMSGYTLRLNEIRKSIRVERIR